MKELFDVLNEKGDYLGKIETREKCHKEGLWHKAVVIFIMNSKGQVLLQKRGANKKMWPNMWDITAGGHVLTSEFGYQAIMRECQEELGIKLNKNDITFIGATISTNKKGDIIDNHFNEYYIANAELDATKITLQEEEVAEIKWMNKNEIIEKVKNNYDGITAKKGCWEYLIKFYEFNNMC